MATNKQFPTLYHRGKSGAVYSWRVWVQGDTIYSDTGQVDGQRVQTSKRVTTKNVGRANATTAAEQALKEAAAMHEHKLSRKYSLTPGQATRAADVEITPMLAQSFEKRKDKHVTYPVDYQNKLDGARAMASRDQKGKVILTSRGRREWTSVTHVLRELEAVLPANTVLDGELYLHGEATFEEIMSWVKRKQESTARIEYHIYDMPIVRGDDTLPWVERRKHLETFFKTHKGLRHLRLVKTSTAKNEAEVMDLHEDSVSQGYEGGIVRTHNGLYRFGYRSADLLKVKAFEDAEFRVIGVTNGIGKFEHCAIFICETKQGQRFNAVPKVKRQIAEKMLKNKQRYIGQLATVQFFGMTKAGVPRFPNVKGFRAIQDLG